MKRGCRFLKNCPFWSAGSHDNEWCGMLPLGEEWEQCPMPKKRDNKIAKRKAKKEKNKKKLLSCFDCQTGLDVNEGHRVFRPIPGPMGDEVTKANICEDCWKRYGGEPV